MTVEKKNSVYNQEKDSLKYSCFFLANELLEKQIHSPFQFNLFYLIELIQIASFSINKNYKNIWDEGAYQNIADLTSNTHFEYVQSKGKLSINLICSIIALIITIIVLALSIWITRKWKKRDERAEKLNLVDKALSILSFMVFCMVIFFILI